MRITRESIYAICMIRALADHEVKSVRIICEDENIPYKWAYKILKRMERAGIVKAFYGAQGGYKLVKGLSQITMLDVLTINERSVYDLENCLHVTQSSECEIYEEFERLANVMRAELRERTMDKVLGAAKLSSAI